MQRVRCLVFRFKARVKGSPWLRFRCRLTDIQTMKAFSIFHRANEHELASSLLSSRFEVRPPSLRHAPSSVWQRLMFWLVAPAPHEASPPLNRLPGVQREFLTALADIDTTTCDDIARRIKQAHSLRELWHLRMETYNLIATHHCEWEAALRLSKLNRHFPTRAPRSGFTPLAA